MSSQICAFLPLLWIFLNRSKNWTVVRFHYSFLTVRSNELCIVTPVGKKIVRTLWNRYRRNSHARLWFYRSQRRNLSLHILSGYSLLEIILHIKNFLLHPFITYFKFSPDLHQLFGSLETLFVRSIGTSLDTMCGFHPHDCSVRSSR